MNGGELRGLLVAAEKSSLAQIESILVGEADSLLLIRKLEQFGCPWTYGVDFLLLVLRCARVASVSHF